MDFYSNTHVYLLMCKFSNVENMGKSLFVYKDSSETNRLVLIQVLLFYPEKCTWEYHWLPATEKF